VATPAADILGMLLLALPMVALYFAAVGVCLLADRRRAKRESAAYAAPA
jgi:sec-independent protein translocase protein TatC